MNARVLFLSLLALATSAQSVLAQNWSFDARKIGLGGVGSTGNLASSMIDEQRDYGSIVLPFGLFQVLKDLDIYDPNSSKFDPVRSIEFAASPLHYVIDRGNTSDAGRKFVNDVRNANLSTNLATYRGFVPPNNTTVEGLASPNFGGTIKLYRGKQGAFQGVYVGAGPYLSLRDAAFVPTELTNVLSGASPSPLSTSFPSITNVATGQVALSVTGGYRGRFAIGSGSDRDGLYVAANYRYLKGFRYEDSGLSVRLDTNGAGNLTLDLTKPSPLVVTRTYATDGTGYAVDLGVGVVKGPWELGVGADGLANRITWTGVKRDTYKLVDPVTFVVLSLLGGNPSIVQTTSAALGDTRVELPVDYRANIAYHADRWSVMADAGDGFMGKSFHAGYEQRFGPLELRGGARYTGEQWNPTGGVGLNLGKTVSIDGAAYITSANFESKRQVAVAASLRFNHRKS